MTVPKIVGGDLAYNWLDVECPECQKVNRIGVTCPHGGKPCTGCGAVLDFWAAWSSEDYAEEMRAELRWYWSQQF